jgi:hypothetical protein
LTAQRPSAYGRDYDSVGVNPSRRRVIYRGTIVAPRAGPVPRPKRDDDKHVTGLVGAALAGGAAALAYCVGAAVLTFRYDGFGMPGQQLVGVTPREQLLIRGGVTLLVGTLAGALLVAIGWVAAALAARRLPDEAPGRVGHSALAARRLPDEAPARVGHSALAAVIAAELVLLATAHVFWPMWLVVALAVYVWMAVRHPEQIVGRAIVGAVAIAVVTLSYESNRLRYGIEDARVITRSPRVDVKGILIGQNDRGVYLGVDRRRGGGLLTVVFVPPNRVVEMHTTSRTAIVDRPSQRARREPVRERVWDALRGLAP